MKKGEIYEGIVKRVDFPNKGKIECDEGEVVVKNVIPGQRIRFMITKKRSGKCEGRLLEVIDKSTIESSTINPSAMAIPPNVIVFIFQMIIR